MLCATATCRRSLRDRNETSQTLICLRRGLERSSARDPGESLGPRGAVSARRTWLYGFVQGLLRARLGSRMVATGPVSHLHRSRAWALLLRGCKATNQRRVDGQSLPALQGKAAHLPSQRFRQVAGSSARATTAAGGQLPG